MKKLLKIFVGTSILITPIISTISCNDNSHNNDKNKIIKITDLGELEDNKKSTIKNAII